LYRYTMGEEEIELPPPIAKAQSTRLSGFLFELLTAMMSHRAIRDDVCEYGGSNAARGLLPSGLHRPTWMQIIMHQVAPAAVEVVEEEPAEEAGEASEAGEGGEEGEGEGAAAEAAGKEEETATKDDDGEEGGGEGGKGGGDEEHEAEKDYEPVRIAGDAPSEHNTVCCAALRALEVAARHPRCRAEILAEVGLALFTHVIIVRQNTVQLMTPCTV
jgi:hypothetical protein